MPHIHYDVVGADTVGTTAGTRESIGTRTTSSIATDLLGFVLGTAGSGTVTAGEALAGKFEIDAKSLAPQDMKPQGFAMRGGGPASNIGSYAAPIKFVPFRSIIQNVANKGIDFYWNSEQNDGSDVTEDMQAIAGIVFSEGSYPLDAMRNQGRLESRCNWMDTANHDDAFNSNGESFDDSITLPNWVKEVVAIGSNITLDTAASAAEPLCPSTGISGTVPSLPPMNVPTPTIHSALGTPVGAGIISFEQILPGYIQNINMVDATLNFTANLNPSGSVASATGLQSISLYGRN